MSRRPEERLGDILEAIHRARLADTRMRSAEAEGDQVGVQVAFDSILHNLFVIGEAVKDRLSLHRSGPGIQSVVLLICGRTLRVTVSDRSSDHRYAATAPGLRRRD